MIEELQEMTYSFETLDELFTKRTIEHAKSLGITPASVRRDTGTAG